MSKYSAFFINTNVPAYKITLENALPINFNSNTSFAFDIYSTTSNPAVTAAVVPYIQRFMDAVSLSATTVASISAAVDSIDGLGA